MEKRQKVVVWLYTDLHFHWTGDRVVILSEQGVAQ